MMPGPDQIVACPLCKGLAKFGTLRSGNTIWARVWTDGKQIAPMNPQPPSVVKCCHCGKSYWLDDAELVGTIARRGDPAPHEVPAAWTAAERVTEPNVDDYYVALGTGLASDREQEKTLRVLAWWRSNDANRDSVGDAAGEKESGARRDNLIALLSLFDETDANGQIMKAEALRELGDFDSARGILSKIVSTEHGAVVSQLSALCEKKDTCVRELKFDRPKPKIQSRKRESWFTRLLRFVGR